MFGGTARSAVMSGGDARSAPCARAERGRISMQIRAPPEAAKHSGAMLVAGLLVAATAAGACPNSFVDTPDPDINICRHYKLPDPMTTEVLCSAATEAFQCCSVSDSESTLPNSTVFYDSACEAEFSIKPPPAVSLVCGQNMTQIVGTDGTTYWSMRCNSPAEPANNNEGLSPGAIAGIAVGAVALVAIAAVVVVF